MIFNKWAIALVMALSFGALAAPAHAVTRVGNTVGAKNIHIKTSIEADMRRAGIPDQCRMEAHNVLRQYVRYDYDDAPDQNARLSVVCRFNVSADQSGVKTGMMGKAMGQRGSVGGLMYVHFKSKSADVERVIIPRDPNQKMSMISRFIHFVGAAPANPTLACTTGGNCSNAQFLMTPLAGFSVNSGYGMRFHPVHKEMRMHTGNDQAAACGTPVLASGDGVVVYARLVGGYGNQLRILHSTEPQKIETSYSHLKSFAVTSGRVKQGQVIAYVGGAKGMPGAGTSTGCHLHFETIVNGNKVDPKTLLGKSGPVPVLTDQQVASLGSTYAESTAALEAQNSMDGGFAGDFVNSCYPTTGGSVQQDESLCSGQGAATNGAGGTTPSAAAPTGGAPATTNPTTGSPTGRTPTTGNPTAPNNQTPTSQPSGRTPDDIAALVKIESEYKIAKEIYDQAENKVMELAPKARQAETALQNPNLLASERVEYQAIIAQYKQAQTAMDTAVARYEKAWKALSAAYGEKK